MSAFSFAFARVAEAARYVRSDAIFFALAVIATALPQILADSLLSEDGSLIVAGMLGLVQIYVNLLTTFRTLDHAGAAPPGYVRADLTEARFGTAFLMSLASTVAIGLGLLALVVPGILLFLLWSLALPILAAERVGSGESLARSWRLARPSLAPVAVVALLWLAALATLIAVTLLLDSAPQVPWLATTIALNLALSALFPFTASVWTFAYLALRAPTDDNRSATA